MTKRARAGISDQQFTGAYRVPYHDGQNLRQHITVTDLDGAVFYDLTGSYGANVFGHDFYKACIAEGSARAAELGPILGSYHPAVAWNVEQLQRISGLDEVRFHMSGSEAFEKNRAKYDEPGRYDLQEAVLSGDTSEAAVRAFVTALNAGTPGDAQTGLRVFKGRPHANLVQSYGPELAKHLEAATVGEWRAFATRDGLRAMRLDAVNAAKLAAFEPLRGVVLQDWTVAVMADQRSAAVRALAKKYTVVMEPPSSLRSLPPEGAVRLQTGEAGSAAGSLVAGAK